MSGFPLIPLFAVMIAARRSGDRARIHYCKTLRGEIATMQPTCGTSKSQFEPHLFFDERVSRRRFVDLKVLLKVFSGGVCAGTIEDISESGCRISLAHEPPFDINGFVGIKFPGSEFVTGSVIWSDPGAVGIRFASMLDTNYIMKQVQGCLKARLEDGEYSRDRVYELPPLERLCD